MNNLGRTKELAIKGGAPFRPQPIEANVIVSEASRSRIQTMINGGLLSRYYGGPWCHRFEREFAKYHGEECFAVATNSGTSALELAVEASDIETGDEVIVPALCFVAAATAIVQAGGIPVICDAEPQSLTMDVERLRTLITPRTKAIVVVHFWGIPANILDIRQLCDTHGLYLIEDCAQGIGAKIDGHIVGSLADFATFAFSVRKHIACGEGGMVLCRAADAADRIRVLCNYGKGPGWDDYIDCGHNYRMAEFPAILGLDGLDRLPAEISERQSANRYYATRFKRTELSPIPDPAWGSSVCFKCPLLLPEKLISRRQSIVDAICMENISCRIPHRPLYHVPWLEKLMRGNSASCRAEDCPTVSRFFPRLIEIETGPFLSADDAEITADAVEAVVSHYSDCVTKSTA